MLGERHDAIYYWKTLESLLPTPDASINTHAHADILKNLSDDPTP